MATLKAAIIPVTPLQQNSCVIWKESSKIAAVTDPGGDLSLIENFITEQGLTLSKVFITHGHLDHAGGCLLYTSPSPRDRTRSRMPSSA